jgi:threonine dehydrogenase-like Zn-dependent dehydrogenase
MRAVKHTEGGVEVVDVGRPRLAGDDPVHVTVRAAGICGSDLHVVGSYPPFPATLGHEIAGVTDDGVPVAIWPFTPCGTCDRCVVGEVQQCRTGVAGLYGLGRDGGMADEIVVERSTLVPLPATVPVEAGSLVEPLACGVHALRRVGLTPDQRVAVVGGGTIGLGAVAAARWIGCQVALSARHDRQRQAGEALGAAIGAGGEHDVVVEAAGTSESFATALSLCRPGGSVVAVAAYWEPLTIAPHAFAPREITIVPANMHGRHSGGRDMDAAAALLAARPEVPEALITHRFPLDAAEEAFRVAADRRAGAIKVVLEP